jgi:hypothetical protein
VALKELRPDRRAQTEASARFLEEAQITGQLERPGIVPVYELVRTAADGKPFYTMRFLRGRTLCEAGKSYHQQRAAGAASRLALCPSPPAGKRFAPDARSVETSARRCSVGGPRCGGKPPPS